ncbi:hypothetical protein [Edaphobacter aggregans]|uniref:hypothetical protein n=1 Tax=Edaphobacter aggregans TaxID=570835 RepID=UPI0012FCC535|nr:hypothetical protein [Edaphobacter aggregans]
MTIKRLTGLLFPIVCLCGLLAAATFASAQNTQQLAFAGLFAPAAARASSTPSRSIPPAISSFSTTRGTAFASSRPTPSANQVLAQAQIGAAGDSGLAMALDLSGNAGKLHHHSHLPPQHRHRRRHALDPRHQLLPRQPADHLHPPAHRRLRRRRHRPPDPPRAG